MTSPADTIEAITALQRQICAAAGPVSEVLMSDGHVIVIDARTTVLAHVRVRPGDPDGLIVALQALLVLVRGLA